MQTKASQLRSLLMVSSHEWRQLQEEWRKAVKAKRIDELVGRMKAARFSQARINEVVEALAQLKSMKERELVLGSSNAFLQRFKGGLSVFVLSGLNAVYMSGGCRGRTR